MLFYSFDDFFLMKTDEGEIVPAFAEIKYSSPDSIKETPLEYKDIRDKTANLFEFLHKEDTRSWIAKTKELGVSWERIFIFYISVWTFPKKINKWIKINDGGIDGGKVVRVKANTQKSEAETKGSSDDKTKKKKEDKRKKKRGYIKIRDGMECIKLEPIKLGIVTKVSPKVTLVLCGNGREGIKKFFGDYIGNRPWFVSNVLKEPKFREPQTKVRRFDEDYDGSESESNSSNNNNNSSGSTNNSSGNSNNNNNNSSNSSNNNDSDNSDDKKKEKSKTTTKSKTKPKDKIRGNESEKAARRKSIN